MFPLCFASHAEHRLSLRIVFFFDLTILFFFLFSLVLVFCFVSLLAFFTVIVLLLSCSPINAPVSSSFAGALRMINVSGSASSALMPRPLNSANYTESFSGVRFAQVLPRVRKIYCDLLLKSSARFIPTDCSYPILMRRSDPHISRQPTEKYCKDHKSDMTLIFVVVIKIIHKGANQQKWSISYRYTPL